MTFFNAGEFCLFYKMYGVSFCSKSASKQGEISDHSLKVVILTLSSIFRILTVATTAQILCI